MKELMESLPLDHHDNGEPANGEPSCPVRVEEPHSPFPLQELIDLAKDTYESKGVVPRGGKGVE